MISINQAIVQTAHRELALKPREEPGNIGPVVKKYCQGIDNVFWCAGFASYCIREGALLAGVPVPYTYTLSCDHFAQQAKQRGAFIGAGFGGAASAIWPGYVFLLPKPKGQSGFHHCGIVIDVDVARNLIHTIEGNTNAGGSPNGDGVYQRTRVLSAMAFCGVG